MTDSPLTPALAAVALATLAVAASAAWATAPGENGKLVFRRYLDERRTTGALFTANADGTGVRQLTRPGKTGLDNEPDWSPDGTKVVYEHSTGPRDQLIFIVNDDGGGARSVVACTGGCAGQEAPAWSPDGTDIAFASGGVRYEQIWIVGVDGARLRRLTGPDTIDADPQWSPDGRRIVFRRIDPYRARKGYALFVINVDGSGEHRLTPWALRAGDHPDWSPDGNRILFRANVEGPRNIGAGDAAGYASDPKRPFQEARANSWATGTNAAVGSIYTRLLAVNPTVQGRAFNFSSHGATVRDLPAQVRKATILKTKPELVLLQFMRNDAPCDGKDDTRYADYQARVTEALQRLATSLPNARILAVSGWGTLDSYIKAVSSYGLGARLTHAGKGICSLFAPKTGKVVADNVAYVHRTSNGYNAAFAAACKAVTTCRYDGGAARRIVLKPADLAHRYESLSIQGLAKLAAVEWKVLYGG